MSRAFWNWVRNQDGSRILTIDGVIAEESWFDDDVTPKLFREQLNAGNGDIVLYVNSPGGDLFTALQFGRAMGDSDATIIVSVEGQCCSAATIIALAADMVELSNHCVWMCHNYSSGAVGKGGELYDQMNFERTWSEGLFRDVYDGFLTDKEINAMLDGRDIWLAADDVMKRLEQRHNKMKRKAKKTMQEIKMTQAKDQED